MSGAINSDSEEIPPCGSFDLDIASIGPGKATFTGRVQCDEDGGMKRVEMKIAGTARRLM